MSIQKEKAIHDLKRATAAAGKRYGVAQAKADAAKAEFIAAHAKARVLAAKAGALSAEAGAALEYFVDAIEEEDFTEMTLAIDAEIAANRGTRND